MSDFKNYYKILGVNHNSTRDEIKSAFREKAKELHPDKNIGQPEEVIKRREEQMKEVADAWGILSRDDAKAKYDRVYQEHEVARPSPRTSEGVRRPQSHTTPRQTDSYGFDKDWADFRKYWDETAGHSKREVDEMFEKIRQEIDEEMKKSRRETEDWLKKTNQETDEWLKKARQETEEEMERIRQTNRPRGEQKTSLEQEIKWGPVKGSDSPNEQTIRFGKSYKPHSDIKWGPVDEEPSGETKG